MSKPSSSPLLRVEEAELQRAGRDADDQPAAIVRSPASWSRPASRRVAAAGHPGRTSGWRRVRPPRPCTRAGTVVSVAVVGGAVTSGGSASCGAPQAVMVASSEQREAAADDVTGTPCSRCPKPTTTVAAAIRPAARTNHRRMSSDPLASSSAATAAAASSARASPTASVKARNVAADRSGRQLDGVRRTRPPSSRLRTSTWCWSWYGVHRSAKQSPVAAHASSSAATTSALASCQSASLAAPLPRLISVSDSALRASKAEVRARDSASAPRSDVSTVSRTSLPVVTTTATVHTRAAPTSTAPMAIGTLTRRRVRRISSSDASSSATSATARRMTVMAPLRVDSLNESLRRSRLAPATSSIAGRKSVRSRFEAWRW